MKFDVRACATARCTSCNSSQLNGYLDLCRAYACRQIVRTTSAQSSVARSLSPLHTKAHFIIVRETGSTGSQRPVTYAL